MSGETISLHFGLEANRNADLEIISQATIAWVETLRALAQAVEPGSDIRVRLVDVDEGSAIYNTIIDWFDRNLEPHLERISTGATKAAPRSRKLVMALTAFTLTTAYPTYNEVFGDDFNEEDRETIKRIEEQTKSPAVQTQRQKFYRTVEREPAINSIGVKDAPDAEPYAVVVDNDFPQEGGLFSVQEGDVPERITQPTLEVTLVKPALVHTPRSWTFKPDGLPEFEAVMRDGKVLQAIQDKGFPAIMREGIRMTIRLEVHEVMIDGQWRLARGGRSVMRVISPKFD